MFRKKFVRLGGIVKVTKQDISEKANRFLFTHLTILIPISSPQATNFFSHNDYFNQFGGIIANKNLKLKRKINEETKILINKWKDERRLNNGLFFGRVMFRKKFVRLGGIVKAAMQDISEKANPVLFTHLTILIPIRFKFLRPISSPQATNFFTKHH